MFGLCRSLIMVTNEKLGGGGAWRVGRGEEEERERKKTLSICLC